MQIEILRVQDSAFRGPYNSLYLNRLTWKPKGTYRDLLHPAPHEEGLKIQPDLFCGFVFFEQYKRWFEHNFYTLYKYNFYLFLLSCDSSLVQRGVSQVLFPLKESSVVAIYSPLARSLSHPIA